MDVLQKKQITKYIAVSVVSLLLGVLLDHFLIYPFFKLDKKQEVQSVEDFSGENNLPIVTEATVGTGEKTLEIPKTCKINVDVSGALKKPGVFCLDEGSMIVDAITKAGGFSSNVAYRFVARKINLSQVLVNNQKIYIPYEEEVDCKLVSFLPQAKEVETIINNSSQTNMFTSESDSGGTNDNNETSCININTSTAEQLDTLNGVGPAMAQKIIEGRPYSAIEDLLNISGIGESTFSKFKEKVCI